MTQPNTLKDPLALPTKKALLFWYEEQQQEGGQRDLEVLKKVSRHINFIYRGTMGLKVQSTKEKLTLLAMLPNCLTMKAVVVVNQITPSQASILHTSIFLQTDVWHKMRTNKTCTSSQVEESKCKVGTATSTKREVREDWYFTVFDTYCNIHFQLENDNANDTTTCLTSDVFTKM